MDRRIILEFLVFFLVVSVSGYPQDQKTNDLKHTFEEHRNANYEEKIYIHLDRPSYLTGETAWFKVYLVNASSYQPSTLSTVAYVEILDRDSTPVLQSKIEIVDGIGSGSLYLPATMGTDNYTIRAYTNWMKNFSADFYFHQEIPIVNPFVSASAVESKSTEKLTVQFYPEGGHLVEGIKSKVAFQILDASGKGVNSGGVVVDENRDTVAAFVPMHAGIGSFYFVPEPDKKYTAILQDSRAGTTGTPLPLVSSVGYVLQVSEETNKIMVEVRANTVEKFQQVYLFIHSRNRTIKASASTLSNGIAQFDMDSAELPEGISHITLFNAKMEPLCERLYFKQPVPRQLKVVSNQSTYLSRGNVKLEIGVENNESDNIFDLSMSVYKVDSIRSKKLNIRNYFLLTSDLKGTVESPEFYFQPSSVARVAADNLMLTHGWRRFVWDRVIVPREDRKEFIPELNGHIIQASATQDGQPAVGVSGYLAAPGKIIRVYPSRSGHDGNLYFEMLNFYGKSKIVVQKNILEDSTSSVKVLSPFSDRYANFRISPLTLSPEWTEQLEERSVAMQVEDIYQKKGSDALPDNIDSTAFYGTPDASYLLDDFTRFPVLEEVLREYVPGVFVRKRKDGFHFLVVNKESNAVFRTSPLILLDGVPILDEDEIMDFDPRLIKRLDVVQRRWLQGPGNFFGIVSFSTYNGDLAGFQLNPSSIVLDYEGLQLQREFYSPKYEDKKQRESRLPDHRTLLYWNPTVLTDETGRAQVEFYTSDLPGEYNVVVEGMNKNGDLHTSTTTFTVKGSN